jgi:hypothetical protein
MRVRINYAYKLLSSEKSKKAVKLKGPFCSFHCSVIFLLDRISDELVAASNHRYLTLQMDI